MKTLYFTIIAQVFLLTAITIAVLAGTLLALVYKNYKSKIAYNNAIKYLRAEKRVLEDHVKMLEGKKDWLEQEIHHRVKNNLQIVISLLNSQSDYLNSADALVAIQNSQNRLHAMSLIHHKLFETNTLSCIDVSWYICEIVTFLNKTYNTGNRINFTVDTNPVRLDVSQAMPLGLILNEALTNTLLHAFPGDKKGMVTILLHQEGGKNYLLRIEDNGVGLPLHQNPEQYEKLGINLMKGLAEQMDGKFYIISGNGVRITIEFIKKNN